MREQDLVSWRTKLGLVQEAAEAELQDEWREIDARRPERDQEARAALKALADDRDLPAFKHTIDEWSRRPGPYTSFSGFGQMWINQIVNYSDGHESEVAVGLAASLSTPSSADDAAAKIEQIESILELVSRNGHPAKARVPFVLSLFWSTDPDDASWPCMWASAPKTLRQLGWLGPEGPNAQSYVDFRRVCLDVSPDDVHRVARLTWYLSSRPGFVGLNPGLLEWCDEAAQIMASRGASATYDTEDLHARAAALAAQLRGDLDVTARGLLPLLRERTGLELEASIPQLRTAFTKEAPYRADIYGTWSLPGGMDAPGFRLWVTRSGVAFGAHAGYAMSGMAKDELAATVAKGLAPGMQFFEVRGHATGDRLRPAGADFSGGDIFVGRWWSDGEALGRRSFGDDILETAGRLQESVLSRFTSAAAPPVPIAGDVATDNLIAEATRFRSERPFPNERDAWQEEQRKEFAEALSVEGLELFDLDVFRRIINGKGYGRPGPQSVLNASISAMDAPALDRFARHLREILWGSGPVAERINRALDPNDLGVKGLGESVILKMFAVTQPDEFLPAFPYRGPMGKVAMMRKLGVVPPSSDAKSYGELQVDANHRLKERLAQLVPESAWGQAQFGYWLLGKDEQPVDPERDLLAETAEKVLVPAPFLREINDLLLSKGQVILYGPPGTGKTYLAQRLAEAIQPDASRRDIVQFHPSTSYEDFFEGYRPRLDERGQMSYELRKGPLALLAERAEAAAGIAHVMIIDEINRANLPRVFGELLFLLEYRSHSVSTSYRPDEKFELPPNLFFIGTMNTADRSIAMVDAALRRRFHFVPFMPHEGPMQGLLLRWLKVNGGPTWVAVMVDRVNGELRTLLGGPHLQIGHSHFMEMGLDDAALERIWTYNIYPFIEDHLYGRPDQLETYTWSAVLKRHGPSAQSGGDESEPDSENDDVEPTAH